MKSACCVRFVFTTVVCRGVHVLFMLFVLLCIVVSYTTLLYEKRGGYIISGRNCLTIVSPWVHPDRCWGPCCSYVLDLFVLLCFVCLEKTHKQHTIGTVQKSNRKIVVICKIHSPNINILPLLFF